MSGFERPNYFTGQLLTEKDLNDQQEYLMEKLRLHNRFLHGCGVVHRLNVSLGHDIIHVSPGVALDCAGNLIIVEKSMDLKLPEKVHEIYVTIKYCECPSDPVPMLAESSGSSENSLQYSRIKEVFELLFELVNPWSCHKRCDSGWLPCGKIHAIPLGRLKYSEGGWRKSRFHPPHLTG